MNCRTDSASSKTWLGARPHFFVRALVEAHVSTGSSSGPIPLRPGALEPMRKTGLGAPLILSDKAEEDLRNELSAWDALSDEALSNFEEQLG